MYSISSLPVVNVSISGWLVLVMIEILFSGSGYFEDLIRVTVSGTSVL